MGSSILSNGLSVVVRTVGDPASLGPVIRRTVAEMDQTLALSSVATRNQVRARVARP